MTWGGTVALGLGVLLMASCAAPLAFTVDPSFSETQRSGQERAADRWNKRTRPGSRITLDGGTWRVVQQAPAGPWNGWCSRSARLVQIRPGLDGDWNYLVAVHEFGHALGLRHTSTGLMQADVVSDEFTPEVLAECQRVEACK